MPTRLRADPATTLACLAGALLATFACAHREQRSGVIDGRPTQLLGGRLIVDAPANGVSRGRSYPIMGAPTPDAEETRVIMDQETERLVLLASETFQTEPAGFDKTAIARAFDLPLNLFNIDPFPTTGGIRAFRAKPVFVTSSEDANVLAIFVVIPPDGVVAVLRFYVNPDAAGNASRYAQIADDLIRTLRPGPRQLVTSAGVRRLGGRLVVAVPDGYVVRQQPGPDFVVYHVQRLSPLGAPTEALGMYLGWHPSRVSEPSGTKVRARLFASEVEWDVGTPRGKEAPGGKILETIQPVPWEGEQKADVWMIADDDASLAELRAVAASIRLDPSSVEQENVEVRDEAPPATRRTRWIKLAQPAGMPAGIAVDETHVYFGDVGGTVYKVPKSGGAAVVLAKGSGWASSLAVDDSFLYWSGISSGRVRRVSKSGGEALEVAVSAVGCKPDSSCEDIEGIAVDDEHVYWARDDAVWSVEKTGGTPTRLVSDQRGAKHLRAAEGDLYWLNARTAEVKRLARGTRTPTTVVSTHRQDAVFAVVAGFAFVLVDEGGGEGALLRVAVTGGRATVVAQAGALHGFRDIASDGKHVFWTTQSPSAVRRIAVGGGRIATVALDQPRPWQIVVDQSGVYWTNENDDQGVMMLAKPAEQDVASPAR